MKKKASYNLYIILISLVFVLPDQAFAQHTITDTTDITTMSLEDLMKNKSQGIPSIMESKIASGVDVASAKPMVLRKSPAILSVITSEEIEHSGARDLMDILNTVPGLDFGVDVEGIVGIAVRGNWANEGKVLLLLDGQELNETVFGTLQFGNTFPLDNIKRIEIIRGPGSAIYGGSAEYAVINIISKNENDGNKISLVSTYGTTQKEMARNTYSLSAAKRIKQFGMSFNGFWGTGIRSDQIYTDIYNNSYNMSDQSKITSLNFNLGINYKNLFVRAMYLNNSFDNRDAYDEILKESYTEKFKTFDIEVKYNIKISEKFMVIPRFTYKFNSPWECLPAQNSDPVEVEEFTYKTYAERYKLNLLGIWDPTDNINLTFGVEGFSDIANKFNGAVFRNSNTQHVSYFNSAVFAQSILKHKIANLTIGGRFEYNNSFGTAFVPRIGLTKRVNKLNFKLLYSHSFKAPSFEHVETSLSNKILPEKTFIWEFETGLQINKYMFLTLNLYDITTKNTIIYSLDTASGLTTAPDGYVNAEKTGSQGIELEYKIALDWLTINAGYSFYSNRNKPKSIYYSSPLQKDEVLGLSNNKFSLNATFNITKSIYVSPSLIIKSEKTGVVGVNANDEYIYKEIPESYILNLFVGKDNFFIKNLKASIGGYNLLNEKVNYVQPYASGHAPLPGLSREFMIKLSYTL